MVRFELIDKEFWSKFGNEIFLYLKFNEEANYQITKQMLYNRDPENRVRACNIGVVFNSALASVKFVEASLQDFDEDGDPIGYPTTNDSYADPITFSFNKDEIDYLKGMLPQILSQIEQNEKEPYTPIEDTFDFLR